MKINKLLSKYDWTKLQELYNAGNTYRDLENMFGVNPKELSEASKYGLIETRNKSQAAKRSTFKRVVSDETRKKLSESRLNYLRNNPDKVPYLLNHSSKKSYPEKLFENALISFGINGYVYNFQNGIYQYDFAFPELKIDVEIDGGTHQTEKVKAIDKRRDEWSNSQGWKVLRFTAKEVKEDVVQCINKLRPLLEGHSR